MNKDSDLVKQLLNLNMDEEVPEMEQPKQKEQAVEMPQLPEGFQEIPQAETAPTTQPAPQQAPESGPVQEHALVDQPTVHQDGGVTGYSKTTSTPVRIVNIEPPKVDKGQEAQVPGRPPKQISTDYHWRQRGLQDEETEQKMLGALSRLMRFPVGMDLACPYCKGENLVWCPVQVENRNVRPVQYFRIQGTNLIFRLALCGDCLRILPIRM